MNILINCPSLVDINEKKKSSLGGVESLVLTLANELSKKNYNITISSIYKKKNKEK